MKKKHPTKHHKSISFEKQAEKSIFLHSERMLTAEGFRRRTPSCPTTGNLNLYRGRRQGKKG
jgi:hypothetical protein